MKNYRVLITGAAGSIGTELSRQVAAMKPKQLLLLDQDESGIFDISEELKGSVPFVADVTNRERIFEIFFLCLRLIFPLLYIPFSMLFSFLSTS